MQAGCYRNLLFMISFCAVTEGFYLYGIKSSYNRGLRCKKLEYFSSNVEALAFNVTAWLNKVY
jgi:hypothetical protein